MDKRIYWLWLQQMFAPGSVGAYSLVRRLGSPQAIFETDTDTLISLAEQPILPSEQERLREPRSVAAAEQLLNSLYHRQMWMVVPEDTLYPTALLQQEHPPLVLYGRGVIPPWNERPCVTVIGSRAPSDYGRQLTVRIAGGLALGGAIVVSGGARGIDGMAHEAAVAVDGITVAVQACGVDVNYPAENAALRERICGAGAVITEFPPGTVYQKDFFRIRNRIVSGLSEATCVIEAKDVRSGSKMTAHLAMEQGRAVYAAAGDALTGRSAGTNTLLREGAHLLTDARDVLHPLSVQYPSLDMDAAATAVTDPRLHSFVAQEALPSQQDPPPVRCCPQDVSVAAQAAFRALADGLTLPEELQVTLGLDAATVLTALTELELSGYAVSDALGRYTLG